MSHNSISIVVTVPSVALALVQFVPRFDALPFPMCSVSIVAWLKILSFLAFHHVQNVYAAYLENLFPGILVVVVGNCFHYLLNISQIDCVPEEPREVVKSKKNQSQSWEICK